MCFERCLLIFTESNFGPKYVSNHVSWHVLGPTLAQKMFWTMTADMYWVQLGPYMCFAWCLLIFTGNTFSPGFFSKIQRCLMTCTGSNFGPRCVVNGVCSYLLGATLALHVFWTMLSDMYWVQLWALDVFWTMSAGMYWVQLGPRCVLIDDCWYALGPTSALGLF